MIHRLLSVLRAVVVLNFTTATIQRINGSLQMTGVQDKTKSTGVRVKTKTNGVSLRRLFFAINTLQEGESFPGHTGVSLVCPDGVCCWTQQKRFHFTRILKQTARGYTLFVWNVEVTLYPKVWVCPKLHAKVIIKKKIIIISNGF